LIKVKSVLNILEREEPINESQCDIDDLTFGSEQSNTSDADETFSNEAPLFPKSSVKTNFEKLHFLFLIIFCIVLYFTHR
jgi:hypothetical protein